MNVYERLGSPAMAAAALRLEEMTNPRLAARKRLMDSSLVDKISPHRVQNWNHAPFAYRNPEGSYWLDGAFGALDLAIDAATALVIAIERREAFLRRTGEGSIDLDMRLLATDVAGTVADLSAIEPLTSSRDRWALGRRLYDEGFSGALYARQEAEGAQCLSVFRGDILGRTVQSTHYRFVWDGTSIKSVYDFSTGDTFIPSELRASLAKAA